MWGEAQRKWAFLDPHVAVVADGFPGEHLHVGYGQDLWQKQVSEHLDLAYRKHSLAKHKKFLPNCFLHVDRGASKVGADWSRWDPEPLISDQDQIQECYGPQIAFFNFSSLMYGSGKSLLRTL